jgi:hypothetical protein
LEFKFPTTRVSSWDGSYLRPQPSSNHSPATPAWLFLEIDIGKLLPCAVDHDKAGVEFFDSPWWWEATRGWEGMDLREGPTYRKQPGNR